MKIPNPGKNFRISDKELNHALKEFPLDVINGNILFYLSGIIFDNDNDINRKKFVKKCFENEVSPIVIEYNYKEDNFEADKIKYFSSNYLSKMGTEGLLSKKGAYGIEFIFNNKDYRKEFNIFRGNYLDRILEDYNIETFNFVFKETFLKGYKSTMKLSCKRNGDSSYELFLLMGKWFREDLVKELNKWSKKHFSKEFAYFC